MSRRQARQVEFSPARLRAFRAEKEWTQEDLARHLGVTLRTITRWEAGTGQPAGSLLLSLADVLGRQPDDLYVAKDAAA